MSEPDHLTWRILPASGRHGKNTQLAIERFYPNIASMGIPVGQQVDRPVCVLGSSLLVVRLRGLCKGSALRKLLDFRLVNVDPAVSFLTSQ